MKAITLTLGKAILGSLPMAALLLLFRWWKPDLWMHGGSLKATLLIAAAVAASVALTLAMYAVLRVPFLTDLFRRREGPA